MNKEPIDQERFDKFLAWLDPAREKAGEKHEKIRVRLMRIFACHGCAEPERLADETIDRVMSKIDWLAEKYVGDPVLFFCGVARYVLKEDIRDRTRLVIAPNPNPDHDDQDSSEEREFECLDGCMEKLAQSNRRVVLAYYQGEGREKIANRSKLAEELGITLRALRLRIFHTRIELRKCMELCLSQGSAI